MVPFFVEKIWVVSSVNMALNWRSSLYTSLLDTGCIPNSTTDTRSETDKSALIFNESLTWGLPVKIHKNQLVKNLCLRMRVQSLSKAYLAEICGTVSIKKVRVVSSVNVALNWRGLFPSSVFVESLSGRYLWHRFLSIKYERFQASIWPSIDDVN